MQNAVVDICGRSCVGSNVKLGNFPKRTLELHNLNTKQDSKYVTHETLKACRTVEERCSVLEFSRPSALAPLPPAEGIRLANLQFNHLLPFRINLRICPRFTNEFWPRSSVCSLHTHHSITAIHGEPPASKEYWQQRKAANRKMVALARPAGRPRLGFLVYLRGPPSPATATVTFLQSS